MRDAPSRSCYVCGSEGRLLHEGLEDRSWGVPGQWNFRRCDNAACRLVWLDPKPFESDLHEAYANYYTHAADPSSPGSMSFQSLSRRVVRTMEQLWLRILFLGSKRRHIDCMFLDDMTPGRLLEVGCGEGRFLAIAQKLGWEVEGQEVDERAADNACRSAGVEVHVGFLNKLDLPSESYDAIVMNHVFEHVFDPIALLRECRRILKKGGVLIATTPNPESYGHRVFGRHWVGLDPPRHLHLFPSLALGRIASQGGFLRHEIWTSAARAGGLLCASLDIRRRGKHHGRGRLNPLQVISACWYQFAASIAYARQLSSGEEIVLRAWK